MQTAPPIPRQATDTHARESHGGYDGPNRKQDPTAGAFLINPFSTRPNKESSENQEPQDNQKSVSITKLPTVSVDRTWQDCLALICTLALVLIGYFGVNAAYKTLKAIEDQGKDTAKAAEAALLNAQFLIHTERPWMFAPWLPDGFAKINGPNLSLPGSVPLLISHANLWVENFGKSPARIFEQKVGLYIGDSQIEIPDSAAYDSKDSVAENFIFPRGTSTPIQAALQTLHITAKEHDDVVVKKTRFLWVCGYCRYRDTFERKESPVYETRFCFRWENNTNAPQPFWILAGPREYSRAT